MPKKCSCGATFYGPGEVCDKCFFDFNYATIENCVIENAEGRCEKKWKCPHYEECLTEAAKRNWIGWRIVKNGNKNKD